MRKRKLKWKLMVGAMIVLMIMETQPSQRVQMTTVGRTITKYQARDKRKFWPMGERTAVELLRLFPATSASACGRESPAMCDGRFPSVHISHRAKATFRSKIASASHSSALSLSLPPPSSRVGPATFAVSTFASGNHWNQPKEQGAETVHDQVVVNTVHTAFNHEAGNSILNFNQIEYGSCKSTQKETDELICDAGQQEILPHSLEKEMQVHVQHNLLPQSAESKQVANKSQDDFKADQVEHKNMARHVHEIKL
jgi:hypothetical protein